MITPQLWRFFFLFIYRFKIAQQFLLAILMYLQLLLLKSVSLFHLLSLLLGRPVV